MPLNDREARRAYERDYARRNPDKMRAKHARWYAKPESKALVAEWNRVYRRKRYAERKQWMTDLVAARGCDVCGESRPWVLDWHHRDPSSMEFRIAGSRVCQRSLESLEAEMAKCDLLCANCHRHRHYMEDV